MRLVTRMIPIFWVILFLSCNKEKNKLEGLWAVDVIVIKGEDRIFDLSINTLDFENNGRCSLPRLEFKGVKEGVWRLEKDDDDRYLVIEALDNVLAGRYRLFYFKDPKKKLYRMSLESDSIRMVCSKALQKYKE